MIRNVKLLKRVMQHIDDHPEQHDQRVWFNECGTAACFAGWACLLSGYKASNVSGFRHELRNSRGHLVFPPIGTSPADKAARRLLGVTAQESRILFNDFNSRNMLRLMVDDLVEGKALRGRNEYEALARLEELGER